MFNPLGWYQLQSNPVKFSSIFSSTLLAVVLIFTVVTTQIGCEAGTLMQPYQDSDTMVNNTIAKIEKPALLTQDNYNLLKLEHSIMSIRKAHHYKLAVKFFRNYYGVLVISMLLSCVGGIVLFILIRRGWEKAGIPLQAFFLGIFVCLTFSGFFPLVFKQEKNLNENMSAYMAYSKAEINVLSQMCYLQNYGPVSERSKPAIDSIKYRHDADSIVRANFGVINGLMNYVLTLDPNGITSMDDIAKRLTGYQTTKN